MCIHIQIVTRNIAIIIIICMAYIKMSILFICNSTSSLEILAALVTAGSVTGKRVLILAVILFTVAIKKKREKHNEVHECSL